jgi:hypothetical protein
MKKISKANKSVVIVLVLPLWAVAGLNHKIFPKVLSKVSASVQILDSTANLFHLLLILLTSISKVHIVGSSRFGVVLAVVMMGEAVRAVGSGDGECGGEDDDGGGHGGNGGNHHHW